MANTLGNKLHYTGAGNLDDKLLCPSYAVLNSTIGSTEREIGMIVTIQQLSTDIKKQAEVWLVGGISDTSWKLKSIAPLNNIDDKAKIPYELLSVGFEVVIINKGNTKKYRVTKMTSSTSTVEWMEVGNFDTSKFSLVANTGNSSVELYYDNQKIGEAANLSDILQDWQYDLHIVSGTTVEEDGKTYLELYTNDLDGDGPDETVRIDVSNLGGGKNYDEEIDTLMSGDTVLQEQIDAIQEKLDSLQVSSAQTTETVTKTEISYTYIDKETGDKVVTNNREEAEENAAEGSEVEEKVTESTTTIITNEIISNISVQGSDMEDEFDEDEIEEVEK